MFYTVNVFGSLQIFLSAKVLVPTTAHNTTNWQFVYFASNPRMR